MKSKIPVLLALLLIYVPLVRASSFIEPTGASQAFTSRDPMINQARALVADGKFHEAETLLKPIAQREALSTNRPATEMLDLIQRIRFEYSLDANGLLESIREVIPDATSADVERWANESHARYRTIDGQKLFFRREPQNIFIFSPDAIRRRAAAGNGPPESAWKLTNHLQAIIDESDRTGKVEVQPVRHRVTYTLTINPDAPGLKKGALVRAWLPYPQEYRQQQDVKLLQASPKPLLIAPSAVDGNPVTGGAQRTIYFEQKITDPAQPIQFEDEFEYVSYAYYPKLEEHKVQPLPADWNGACLGERPPHIVFTPDMKAQVSEIIGTETNSLAKARRLFRWVSAHIPWNAEDEYCIVPSLSQKGFTSLRGDCGVQNTVFITLCRIAGLPARWQSGFETKPRAGWGMHDWAEIYIAPWGWLPADASYGVQKSDDPRIADFYCGHQDSYRMIVNLDWGRELFPPKQSLRSEPADFQRGEVEVDGTNLYYNQWTYVMEVERTPGPNSD